MLSSSIMAEEGLDRKQSLFHIGSHRDKSDVSKWIFSSIETLLRGIFRWIWAYTLKCSHFLFMFAYESATPIAVNNFRYSSRAVLIVAKSKRISAGQFRLFAAWNAKSIDFLMDTSDVITCVSLNSSQILFSLSGGRFRWSLSLTINIAV